MSRIALSKKTRFEVFKRDAFTCQYCGKKAPEIVLQCDHIVPVASGGGNDLLNLVTSCIECNAGKGARELSDQSVLVKQMDQMVELQERREQIEMLLQWRRGLDSLQADTVEAAAAQWAHLSEDTFFLNKSAKDKLRKLIKDFGMDLVLRAMSEAFDSYAKRNDDELYTDDSINHAFNKLGGVCRVLRDSQDKPYLKRIFYIRGILRGRLNYLDERECFRLIERAVELNVDLDSVERIAKTVRSWSGFRQSIESYIESREEDK